LAGCAVGPKYARPTVETPPAYKEEPPQSFKEAGVWKPAQPADQQSRGKWWEIFGDPQLNMLEEQVTVSNQNLSSLARISHQKLIKKASTVQFREVRLMCDKEPCQDE
jgi:outer membrane protein TolC